MSQRLSSRRLSSDYGMLGALLALCLYYSWATLAVQHPNGRPAAESLAARLRAEFPTGTRVLIVARDGAEDRAFTETLRAGLTAAGFELGRVVNGQPGDARQAIEELLAAGRPPQVLVVNQAARSWTVIEELGTRFPALATAVLVSPTPYTWPNFLKAENLLNIANQIAVIAILAIGMTWVIVAGGIDLSVGSLIALAAVTATLLVRDVAGAEQASALGMTLACAGAVAVAGLTGLASGLVVTGFGIPPFIATLAMMLVASGLAFLLARGQSVYQVPDSFTWLGRGSSFGLPHAVWLMAGLYAAAHIVMSRHRLGRYIYAVGGNAEAARLSGVPVKRVVTFTYVASGLLSGLGGVVMASQLKSGAPTYGQMYELYVIAAVVVGGTSLSGGRGTVLGTLIGAFIIAVIQNGMNLTGVESYTQKVVLGLVILGAVLLDLVKRRAGRQRSR